MAAGLNIFCVLPMVLNFPISGSIQKHPMNYYDVVCKIR